MFAWLSAVFLASLLGSFHCVCMCGPIAIWSSGSTASATQRKIPAIARITGYHLGRLLTYTVLGVIAGLAGSAFGQIGSLFGIQASAARLVGVLMIVMGIGRVIWLVRGTTSWKPSFIGLAKISNSIASTVASIRPHVLKLPLSLRSVATGALTVLLPCGWLYLFVLVAAGGGSVRAAILLMFAFWLGTVPALVALVAGSLKFVSLSRGSTPWLMPTIGAITLVVCGWFTATGRAAADLSSLGSRGRWLSSEIQVEPSKRIHLLTSGSLPCCENAN